MKKLKGRKWYALLLVTVLLVTSLLGVDVSAKSKRPNVSKFFVNKGNDTFYQFKTKNDKINNAHYFKFRDYLNYYGESVTYYGDDDVSDGDLYVKYMTTGGNPYNISIRTYIYVSQNDNRTFGGQYSSVKVISEKYGSWESKPDEIMNGDIVADCSEGWGGAFFYVSRNTFKTFIELTQAKDMKSFVENNTEFLKVD